MKISKKLLNEISNSISNMPPETGGILGSTDNNIITHFVMDKMKNLSDKVCCYEPNVKYLNSCIDEWFESEIFFIGIFHTHFAGVKSLSCADKKYINTIMSSMPEEVSYLYFPVFVFPDRKMICYKAEKIENKIVIYQEELEIL